MRHGVSHFDPGRDRNCADCGFYDDIKKAYDGDCEAFGRVWMSGQLTVLGAKMPMAKLSSGMTVSEAASGWMTNRTVNVGNWAFKGPFPSGVRIPVKAIRIPLESDQAFSCMPRAANDGSLSPATTRAPRLLTTC